MTEEQKRSLKAIAHSIAGHSLSAADGDLQPQVFHRIVTQLLADYSFAMRSASPTPDQQQKADALRALREFTSDQKVIDFAQQHKIVLHGQRQWHWCSDQREGWINGLEGKRGTPRISNGIEVYIELADKSGLFLGHLEWFTHGASRSYKYPMSYGKGTKRQSAVPSDPTEKQRLSKMLLDLIAQ